MKFIISSSILSKNIQALSGVLNANNALPILDDFLFELQEGKLFITASDLETTMTVTLEPTKSEDPGTVAIPARILLDTLKTFSDIPLTFTVNKESMAVEISAGEGKYKLVGHNSDEFPQKPTLENTNSVSFESFTLLNAINKTLFATGNDELRPVMSGVFCELTPEEVTFVATDSHKLVRYRRNDLQSELSSAFIMPKKPLNQLKQILSSGEDEEVKIEYNQTNAFFRFANVSLVCRLIEGRYPNYEAVIPTTNPNILTINRASLLNSIRRVAIFSNKSTHQVRFKISGRELLLSAEDLDYSNEAKERLTCNYEGEDMEIGFNSKFLQEMLSNLETEDVRIEMSAPNRAGLLIPVTAEEEKEDILMLIMPVMLNQ